MWVLFYLVPATLHVEDEVAPTRVCDFDHLRLLIPQSGKVLSEH